MLEGSGSFLVRLSLYEVDGQNNPVGPPLITEDFSGITILSTPGYFDFALGTNGWTALRAKKHMLTVSCNTIVEWVTTTTPAPPAGGPWADFVAYRGTTDGIVWSDSASFGAVQLNATPIPGIPVMVNGVLVSSNAFTARGPAVVTIQNPYTDGTVFYTLDGSSPATNGALYAGPLLVTQTATLHVIAYTADFLHSSEADPLAIVILPNLVTATAGGGSVAIAPPDGPYFSNSTAVVTATPAPGWTFLQWLGDAYGTNPTASVTMWRDKTVRAVFGTTLATNIAGSGSIVPSPDAPLYPYGQSVRLTATPQPGSYFVTWGTAASGANNPLLFTVTQTNPTVTAVFASLGSPQSYALTVVCDGNGTVARLPAGNRFPSGTNVTLTALPESGQDFLGWGGDASGTQNPLGVPLNQSKIITARFTKRPKMLVEDDGQGLNMEGFRVVLVGEFGQPYVIRGSTNLTDWSDLALVTNNFGTSQWLDSGGTNFSRRFYRAVSNP